MMSQGVWKLWFIVSLCFFAAACQSPSAKAKRELNAELQRRETARKESEQLYVDGIKAYHAADLKEARGRLQRAVGADDQNFSAWMALGATEFASDRYYEAAQAFDAAKRLQPSRFEPHFNLGTVFEFVGHYQKAIDAYEIALALAPDQVEVMENLARTYIKSGRNLDKARELIGRALTNEYRLEWRHWLEAQTNLLSKPAATLPTTHESTVK
jgi:tetratricopeptide (TPR) repeat protein